MKKISKVKDKINNYISKNYIIKQHDLFKQEDEYIQKTAITPSWMKKGKYKMPYDKYYTKLEIAQYCYKSLLKIAEKYNFKMEDYTFLEPAAGNGAFFNLLPSEKRIGMDIKPECNHVIKQDFFDFNPEINKKYVTIGNPPFGIRSWLALAFINKAAQFSDLVGFILPMYFDSEGKGSAKNRVKGLNLLHSEELDPDIFHNGSDVSINTVWQVWGKVKNVQEEKISTKTKLEIFTVCTNPTRRCGLDKLNQYNFFIQSTFYTNVALCDDFKDVKYGSGYGIIIKDIKKIILIKNALNKINWVDYSTRATNHCRHIGRKHILKAIMDCGY